MLGFFRRIINSKAGLVITFLTLGVIAIAFAAGDVTGLASGSGGMTKTTVARVGRVAIGEAQLKQRVGDQLNQLRQEIRPSTCRPSSPAAAWKACSISC